MDINDIKSLLGIEPSTSSHKEKLLSVAGVVLSMFIMLEVNYWLLDDSISQILINTSVGATAILLFASPQGSFSQPWAVLGGHMISAFVGVTCAHWVPDLMMASALAVSFSLLIMSYLGCIHPPGGGTAIAAIVGGVEVEQLGYHYLVTPVLINILILLALAVVFNNVFPWRRYPAFLLRIESGNEQGMRVKSDPPNEVTLDDIENAMEDMDGYFEMSAEQVKDLLDKASLQAEQRKQAESSLPGYRRMLQLRRPALKKRRPKHRKRDDNT